MTFQDDSGYIIPVRRSGYLLPIAERSGRYSCHFNRAITDPLAEKLIRERKADMVGVGRALLKDSLWAKKAYEALVK